MIENISSVVLLLGVFVQMCLVALVTLLTFRMYKRRRSLLAMSFLRMYSKFNLVPDFLWANKEFADIHKTLLNIANGVRLGNEKAFTLSRSWVEQLTKANDISISPSLHNWISTRVPDLQLGSSKIHPWLLKLAEASRPEEELELFVYTTTRRWNPKYFGLEVKKRMGRVYQCVGNSDVVKTLEQDEHVLKIE